MKNNTDTFAGIEERHRIKKVQQSFSFFFFFLVCLASIQKHCYVKWHCIDGLPYRWYTFVYNRFLLIVPVIPHFLHRWLVINQWRVASECPSYFYKPVWGVSAPVLVPSLPPLWHLPYLNTRLFLCGEKSRLCHVLPRLCPQPWWSSCCIWSHRPSVARGTLHRIPASLFP